ncbi:hypothetical protein ABZP36_027970 [Zizania latifolia]
MISTLVGRDGGVPLWETSAPGDVRPRPPAEEGAQRRGLQLASTCWRRTTRRGGGRASCPPSSWRGGVGGRRGTPCTPVVPGCGGAPRLACPAVAAFVRGRWMDAREVASQSGSKGATMEMNNNTVDTSSKEQAHCHLEISMNSKKIKGASHYECDPPLHANVKCQFPGMQQVNLHLCMLA